jgi:hypothetical protein
MLIIASKIKKVFNSISKFLRKVKFLIVLDDAQLKFVQGIYYRPRCVQKTKIGLVQCAQDYKYLYLITNLLNNDNFNNEKLIIKGVWPYIGLHGIIKIINFKTFFLWFIFNMLAKRKWGIIYQSLSIKKMLVLGFSVNPLVNFFYLFKSIFLFKKFKIHNDPLNFKVDGLIVGDLIVSTYIRFRENPELSKNDFFIWLMIFKILIIKYQAECLINKYNISFYVTSYTSYVQHGVISRIMIERNIPTYSLGSFRPIVKRHISGDFSHRVRWEDYPNLLYQHSRLIELTACARNALENRFSGFNDDMLAYMKKSSFSKEIKSFQSKDNYDAVIYLHDFYDSCYDLGYMLFETIYAWVEHAVKFISANNLNIAFKPHPNQNQASSSVVNDFMVHYPNIKWLDKNISNSEIFEKSSAGISIFGTILYELAYHDKVAIAAGSHPAMSFDLSFQPKTILEYEKLLLEVGKLKPKDDCKSKAIAFYAAHSYLTLPGDRLLDVADHQGVDWECSTALSTIALSNFEACKFKLMG